MAADRADDPRARSTRFLRPIRGPWARHGLPTAWRLARQQGADVRFDGGARDHALVLTLPLAPTAQQLDRVSHRAERTQWQTSGDGCESMTSPTRKRGIADGI